MNVFYTTVSVKVFTYCLHAFSPYGYITFILRIQTYYNYFHELLLYWVIGK